VDDVNRLADLVFALDHPYDPESVVRAAAMVAELVRRLNHATLHRATLPDPAQLDQIVGRLQRAVQGLTQTLGQLANQLDWYATDPHISHDRNLDPTGAAVHAAEQLRTAAGALITVARHMDAAHQTTSHLYHDAPDHPAHPAPPAEPTPGGPPPLPPSPRAARPRRTR
jgi:hypothetical protein